jgi:hypothetical protein
MLKSLQSFRPVVSLVPGSGVQFLDFGFNSDEVAKVGRAFWEEEDVDVKSLRRLRYIKLDPKTNERVDARDLVETTSPRRKIPEERIYEINARRALETYENEWVPLPVLRIMGRTELGELKFAEGPSNWARVFVTPLSGSDSDGNTHRIVVAFDTDLLPQRPGSPYLSPTSEDSRDEQEFALAHKEEANSWLLNEPWFGGWLEELYLTKLKDRRGGRPVNVEDLDYQCEHWARYLTLLEVLNEANLFPRFKLIDTHTKPAKYTPVDVDLVLDVGNSRTTGIMIEASGEGVFDLNNSYVVELRDLTNPQCAYRDPFESRIEFSRTQFGNDSFSRRSGRANAFPWPSMVRVGPEATRLAAHSLGVEGSTGLSSPKRYLWDEGSRNQDWRFNAITLDDLHQVQPALGRLTQFLTEEGLSLHDEGGSKKPALRPRFSRSSLMMFGLQEIILQAVVQINSAGNRSSRPEPDAPRQFRRIIMTMPTAMPLVEQRILKRRTEDAIEILWQLLGWTESNDGFRPPIPQVMLNWDEATSTQLVYLYTEVTQRFMGDIPALMEMLGRERPRGSSEASLRVASIDIGGGTTDLIISTYKLESDRRIDPVQDFREGFNIAGDDIVCAVVEGHILPAIANEFEQYGPSDSDHFMDTMFGRRRGEESEAQRHFRKYFAIQIASVIAIDMLKYYENINLVEGNTIIHKKFDEFFENRSEPPLTIVEHIDKAAEKAGATAFSLKNVEFEINPAAIEQTIRGIIRPILDDMCEIIYHFDCDVLLLTGRPSMMPVIEKTILANLPLPPDRVIMMGGYKVGSWYPFRNQYGRIGDPKTTVAIGAMLCSLAEGQLEALMIRSSRFKTKSTARFIGRMEITGQIKNDNVMFANFNDDEQQLEQRTCQIDFDAPTSIGFRQLDVERWPATPLYWLEFTNPSDTPKLKLPLKLTIEGLEVDEDNPNQTNLEIFKIAEIEDAEGTMMNKNQVTMRLRTLKSDKGYWLDNGEFQSV